MANWEKLKSRGRVTDRRSNSSSVGRISFPGLNSSSSGGLPIPIGGLGIKGILAVGAIYLVISLLSGGGSFDTLTTPALNDSQVSSNSSVDDSEFEGEDSYEVFASTVLGSVNDMWVDIFNRNNLDYREPELVLFRNATTSACGGATSDIGPHYCPADETIYIDETFFDELFSQVGATGGDVAEAYIIGHEVAHHVQNLLGLTEQLNRAQQAGASNVNELSVEIELQADCFSGLWANSINDLGVFEFNEIEEALNAAAAVGDDRIQETFTGQINPESWTHGSSDQRQQWFNTGFVTGDFAQCQI